MKSPCQRLIGQTGWSTGATSLSFVHQYLVVNVLLPMERRCIRCTAGSSTQTRLEIVTLKAAVNMRHWP